MSCEARKLLPSHKNNDIIIVRHDQSKQHRGSTGVVVSREEDDHNQHHGSPYGPFTASRGGSTELQGRQKDSTGPGHSPGVGHLTVSTAQINQDFRPFTPESSPSAGHSISNHP
ncbi:hypothetical protein CRG98_028978 [Punica granatum]|uniref:Uncharacterized protein n=1 Tax=Punica granatum TaxID=22663 RepID=A0A2I0J4K1_PUNGR|nr:hypothetical protein CRG98_028978 [Punica granatum]